MKYGIAMFPSKELQDKANSLRKRYDSHYALIPPHITMKAPFEVDEENVKETMNKLKKIADETPPIQIKFSRVSSFHPINNVIYFKIDANEELLDLYDRLHTDELGVEEEYTFVPHLTIAQNLTDEEHSDVLESMRMKEIYHEEVIDRFQILYQLDNGSWTVYETFRLGKTK